MKNNQFYKFIRISIIIFTVLILVYFVLLIPEPHNHIPERSENQPFIWDQDSLWLALERRFINARKTGCIKLAEDIKESFTYANKLLGEIKSNVLPAEAAQFSNLENTMFHVAPLVGACSHFLPEYIELFSTLRYNVKRSSHYWDMNSIDARQTIYRLLYGGRAAIEEIMLQASEDEVPACIMGHSESSQTPNASILGVTIYSGDILVSRGGAPTSALIARGNDYPGNFSHVALVHIDEKTHLVSIIEAQIEKGVTITTLNDYLKDKKLRVMVLRLRAELPQLKADPMLPHKAASFALDQATTKHIAYDFEMNFQDNSKQFCSEVVSSVYKQFGVNLWMGISCISSEGIARWLSYFGVKYFETQEPSDLEYDPQLVVVAEWRDYDTLFKDHVDNAVIEVMLNHAENGKELNYSWYLLPIARIVKLYSSILNIFDFIGPIPEGMSATASLRTVQLKKEHNIIKSEVLARAKKFELQNGYTSPYWQLINFTKDIFEEIDNK